MWGSYCCFGGNEISNPVEDHVFGCAVLLIYN